jgi:hypothetical protein
MLLCALKIEPKTAELKISPPSRPLKRGSEAGRESSPPAASRSFSARSSILLSCPLACQASERARKASTEAAQASWAPSRGNFAYP